MPPLASARTPAPQAHACVPVPSSPGATRKHWYRRDTSPPPPPTNLPAWPPALLSPVSCPPSPPVRSGSPLPAQPRGDSLTRPVGTSAGHRPSMPPAACPGPRSECPPHQPWSVGGGAGMCAAGIVGCCGNRVSPEISSDHQIIRRMAEVACKILPWNLAAGHTPPRGLTAAPFALGRVKQADQISPTLQGPSRWRRALRGWSTICTAPVPPLFPTTAADACPVASGLKPCIPAKSASRRILSWSQHPRPRRLRRRHRHRPALLIRSLYSSAACLSSSLTMSVP